MRGVSFFFSIHKGVKREREEIEKGGNHLYLSSDPFLRIQPEGKSSLSGIRKKGEKKREKSSVMIALHLALAVEEEKRKRKGPNRDRGRKRGREEGEKERGIYHFSSSIRGKL